jgi:uncharacterized protein (TIGR02145 family)
MVFFFEAFIKHCYHVVFLLIYVMVFQLMVLQRYANRKIHQHHCQQMKQQNLNKNLPNLVNMKTTNFFNQSGKEKMRSSRGGLAKNHGSSLLLIFFPAVSLSGYAVLVSMILTTASLAVDYPSLTSKFAPVEMPPSGGGLTTAVQGSSFCSGATVVVSFSAPGSFQAGNTFTVQLSNAAGSFASPVNIGSLTGIYSGAVNAVIPAGTPAGSGYRIRVVASSPYEIGADNGSDLVVNAGVQITTQPSRSSHKMTANITAPGLSITASGGSGLSYQWYRSLYDSNTGGNLIPGATAASYQPVTSSHGTTYYYCTVSNGSGCTTVSRPSGFVQVCTSGTILLGSGIGGIGSGWPDTMQVSACDSYTWAETGLTYTQSGEYTSTNVLQLTITPSTTNTTTASACDSYTWSVNGSTYTQSGTFSSVSGCVTEVLNLTITSTTTTSTVVACTTYTWSANSTTYTQSGSYTAVSGCTTQVLNLTIENLCDVDGNAYDTVVIGTQVWMSENLKTSKYRNGDPIPTNLNNTTWQNTTSGAYAIYNNTASNDSIYGKLYNGYAVADSRGLCPTGWHVPSDADWQTLESSLGMLSGDLNLTGGRGSAQNVGGKMKATGIAGSGGLWNFVNTGATNSSGFTGLPGGARASVGTFVNVGGYGYWWSSTQYSSTGAWDRNLHSSSASSNRDGSTMTVGFSVRCVRDAAPTVTTSSADSITPTSATSGGNVTDAGSDPVTARGVCWSTSPNPTVALSTKTTDGSGSGTYTSSITGLQLSTTYYIRAYATNGVGTGYGSEVTFTTLATGQFTDIDGNVYDTIAIGTQVWMKQNLKTSKYRNGDPIPTNLNNTTWQNTTLGAYAIYDNTAANDNVYGKLYNWYAVADSRGLCPTGWHVPSDAEWTTLENFLGGSSVAGGKMKAVSSLWDSPNRGATNSSGFTGLPGGLRNFDGPFVFGPNAVFGNEGYWWSSTQHSSTNAWYRYLRYDSAYSDRDTYGKMHGLSVRCVRD